MRIVSLIPEATEILHAIGLADEVVALPATDAFDAGLLWDAQTTHVFTSDTATPGGMARHLVRRHIALMAPKPRPAVYALGPRSVGDILSDVKTVGDAVGRQAAARTLIESLRARIDAVTLRAAHAHKAGAPKRVVCLDRADPPVAAGWWLAEVIGLAGGIDVLGGVGRPPRSVTWEEIQAAEPDLIVRADLTPLVALPLSIGTGRDVGARPREHRPAADRAADESYAQRPGGGAVPGPGVVDLLEQLAALIVPGAGQG